MATSLLEHFSTNLARQRASMRLSTVSFVIGVIAHNVVSQELAPTMVTDDGNLVVRLPADKNVSIEFVDSTGAVVHGGRVVTDDYFSVLSNEERTIPFFITNTAVLATMPAGVTHTAANPIAVISAAILVDGSVEYKLDDEKGYISIDKDTGAVFGKHPPVSKLTTLTFEVTVTSVSNLAPKSVSRKFSINIAPMPEFKSSGKLATIGDNVEYENIATVSVEVAGVSVNDDVEFTLSGAFPSGLELDAKTGLIKGKPDRVKDLTEYTFEIQASLKGPFEVYGVKQETTAEFSIVILPTPVFIDKELPAIGDSGNVSVIVNVELLGSNNLKYLIISGQLPPGLVLITENGVAKIEGQSTLLVSAKSDFTFSIRATSVEFETTAEKQFTLSLYPAPVFTTAAGLVFKSGQTQPAPGVLAEIEATINYATSLSFTVTGGTLPPDTTLDSKTGQIKGKSVGEKKAIYTFEVSATTSEGVAQKRTFIIEILGAAPNFITKAGEIFNGFDKVFNIGAFQALSLNGDPVKFSLHTGKLPTGLSLKDDGSLTGTVNVNVKSTFKFTIRAYTSEDALSAYREFSMVIDLYRDGSEAKRGTTPAHLRKLGITKSGVYYIQAKSIAHKVVQAHVQFNKKDNKDWILMTTIRKNGGCGGCSSTVIGKDLISNSVPFKGFLIDVPDGNTYYSYFTAYQKYNPSGSQTRTTGGNKNNYKVFLGGGGRHGFYNSGQNPCSWGNACGAVGAGYDGSCGGYPGSLRLGYGNCGNPYYHNYRGGDWKFWIWMSDAE
eukprot:m.32507 g.32507  ORF g.32507 m.32507 type:complete len:778 (-) comp8421_c0_seq1:75-2408(-)